MGLDCSSYLGGSSLGGLVLIAHTGGERRVTVSCGVVLRILEGNVGEQGTRGESRCGALNTCEGSMEIHFDSARFISGASDACQIPLRMNKASCVDNPAERSTSSKKRK